MNSITILVDTHNMSYNDVIAIKRWEGKWQCRLSFKNKQN